MATRSREILRKVDNDSEGGRQGCLPPAKEAHSPSRTLSAIKKPTTACSWKFSANPSIQTHETKEGEHSEAELECSALYNESGDSEPAAPSASYFWKARTKVFWPSPSMKMESRSAKSCPAGSRAGDEIRRDPHGIQEEAQGIRAEHRFERGQNARR
ncbi:hypothetical protein B0H14DRAFT_2578539 [Mycena olivaceomarginata]|nr:hypothetical protein B0H14DRAFT_2578539 [Mycena olivaceomarginata]